MPLLNTATSYGSLARLFHWLIATGILAMIPLGWTAHLWPMTDAADIGVKTTLFSAHKTLGVGIFAVALARIAFAVTQTRPVPLHPDRRAETLLAEAVHWALYLALVLVPLSGWIEHAATDGFAPIWWPFGQDLPLVPKSPEVASLFAHLHFLAQWLLVGALGLHVAGAMKHALVDRDATLSRMSRGTAAGHPAARAAHTAPALIALAIWAALLGGGAVAGLSGAAPSGDAPRLEQTASEWTVQDGTLAIAVTQMGSEVTGSFAEWTAAIDWQQSDTPDREGAVTVQISVPSLTLGSVTSQALGADFFAASDFPTARFTADLVRTDSGREAQGTLDLKGASVPVTLPFELTVDGNTARMSGRATLDRRNYDIGSGMSDPGQLAYDVEVRVDLTATRGAD